MSVLRVSLFGGFRIAHDRLPPEVNVTRSVQTLLAYLLLQHNRSHHREVLAAALWGDFPPERAHNCLNTALWRARQVLEPPGVKRGTYLTSTAGGEVGFNHESDYWLDVAVFEGAAKRMLAMPIEALDEVGSATLEQALQLHDGELLEGYYHDWVLSERERLRLLYVSSLAHLMRYHEHRGSYTQSIAYAQQILRYDPLREEIHRKLMRLYVRSGERALALRQYETCRDVLAMHLSIGPMEETEALYKQIIYGDEPIGQAPTQTNEPCSFQQALDQLHLAMQLFDEARQRLERAMELAARWGSRNRT